jgi:hypothetical protein
LHNMRVEEFVSGSEPYKPDDAIYDDNEDCSRIDIPSTPKNLPQKVKDRMNLVSESDRSQVGRDCYIVWRQKFRTRWKNLTSNVEHKRLRGALMNHIYRESEDYKRSKSIH